MQAAAMKSNTLAVGPPGGLSGAGMALSAPRYVRQWYCGSLSGGVCRQGGRRRERHDYLSFKICELRQMVVYVLVVAVVFLHTLLK